MEAIKELLLVFYRGMRNIKVFYYRDKINLKHEVKIKYVSTYLPA